MHLAPSLLRRKLEARVAVQVTTERVK